MTRVPEIMSTRTLQRQQQATRPRRRQDLGLDSRKHGPDKTPPPASVRPGEMYSMVMTGVLSGVAVLSGTVVHELAGTAGDVVLIIGAMTLILGMLRRVWRSSREAMGDLREIRSATEAVPGLTTEVREYIGETRRRQDGFAERLSHIEDRLDLPDCSDLTARRK